MKFTKIITLLLCTTPTNVFAFDLFQSDFAGVIAYVIQLLYIVIPILSSLAFLLFFWGLSKFILSGSNDQANRKKGKDYMMWGILALFILLTYRTIISLISSDLDIGNAQQELMLPTGSGANVTTSCVVQLPGGGFAPCN